MLQLYSLSLDFDSFSSFFDRRWSAGCLIDELPGGKDVVVASACKSDFMESCFFILWKVSLINTSMSLLLFFLRGIKIKTLSIYSFSRL